MNDRGRCVCGCRHGGLIVSRFVVVIGLLLMIIFTVCNMGCGKNEANGGDAGQATSVAGEQPSTDGVTTEASALPQPEPPHDVDLATLKIIEAMRKQWQGGMPNEIDAKVE
jgi:hypothetical protein